MIHATPRTEEGKLAVPVSNNGCTVKTVRYIGKAAHAGGMPHRGINALYAANIALSAGRAVTDAALVLAAPRFGALPPPIPMGMVVAPKSASR